MEECACLEFSHLCSLVGQFKILHIACREVYAVLQLEQVVCCR